jgi:hypothetical protein
MVRLPRVIFFHFLLAIILALIITRGEFTFILFLSFLITWGKLCQPTPSAEGGWQAGVPLRSLRLCVKY